MMIELVTDCETLPRIPLEKDDITTEDYKRTALEPWRGGQIVALGYTHGILAPRLRMWGDIAMMDQPNAVPERVLLEWLWAHVSRYPAHQIHWIGHNVWFDLKFYAVRALIHNLDDMARTFWRGPDGSHQWGMVTDTQELAKGARWEPRKGHGLEGVCRALEIESNNPIRGGEVLGCFQRGDFHLIWNHLKGDLIETREVYRRFKEAGIC